MNDKIILDIFIIIFAIGFITCAWIMDEPFYWKVSCLALLAGLIIRMSIHHIDLFVKWRNAVEVNQE